MGNSKPKNGFITDNHRLHVSGQHSRKMSRPNSSKSRQTSSKKIKKQNNKRRGRASMEEMGNSRSSGSRKIGINSGKSSVRKGSEVEDDEMLDELLGLMPDQSGMRPRSVKQKNRYDGLTPVQQLSKTKLRKGRERMDSYTSGAKLSFVAGDRAISFDEMLSPPPPPPLDDSDESNPVTPPPTTPNVKLSDEDITFVEYTVVPLLLRADVEYQAANKFGAYLKKRYKGTHIRFIMSKPSQLFAAMQANGMKVSDDLRRKVVDDDFWKQNPMQSRQRRTSFVYYKETKSPTPSKPRRGRTSRSSMRDSVKTEFNQERQIRAEDQEFRLDDLINGVLRPTSSSTSGA